MTTLITYRGTVVAVAGATRFHLAPWVETLGRRDPLRAIVALMCVFAERVHAGELRGPYSDQRAELYARSALIDDAEFTRSTGEGLEDHQLAERFNVPPEQIDAKRHDVHA
jgi:hypothetical protein